MPAASISRNVNAPKCPRRWGACHDRGAATAPRLVRWKLLNTEIAMALERVVYCSKSNVPTDNLLVISEILAVSDRNNRRDDLTGALAINDGWFFQVIEGPTPALDNLLRRLQSDKRHRDFVVLQRREIKTRLFGDWSMTSERITPAIGADLAALINECRSNPDDAVAGLLRIVSQ